MTFWYAILTGFMAALNVYRGIRSGNPMNYVMALLWLCIAVYFIVKANKSNKQK